MASADDKQALRRMARAAIATGLLPGRQPERVWGGKGTGSTCAVCARTIDAIELEFELEFAQSEEVSRDGALRMHARCFAVWDCEQLDSASPMSNHAVARHFPYVLPSGCTYGGRMTDSISHEITIHATPERVWELLTRPEHIARWYAFDGADIDLRPGGKLAFRWREHGEFRGRVERVEKPHAFSFRFVGHVPGQDPDPRNSTLVTFTLRKRGGATLVRVEESGFDALIDPKEGAASKSAISLEGWRGGFEALAAYAKA